MSSDTSTTCATVALALSVLHNGWSNAVPKESRAMLTMLQENLPQFMRKAMHKHPAAFAIFHLTLLCHQLLRILLRKTPVLRQFLVLGACSARDMGDCGNRHGRIFFFLTLCVWACLLQSSFGDIGNLGLMIPTLIQFLELSTLLFLKNIKKSVC